MNSVKDPFRRGNSRIVLDVASDRSADDEFDSYFKGMFISQKFGINFLEKAWMPPTDAYETDKEMVVRMEIPGIMIEDVTINVTSKRLVIRGKRADSSPSVKRTYIQMEINYGAFERAIPLSRPLDLEATSARYENGFLVVTIPFSKKMRERSVTIPIVFE